MTKNTPNNKETNIKVFLQTEAYQIERNAVQFALNNNSQAFNSKIPQPSNLVEPKPIGGLNPMAKTKTERTELKHAKKAFAKNPDAGRENIVTALVQSDMPNWNIVFKERK